MKQEHKPKQPRCKTCRFFQPWAYNAEDGQCRKESPKQDIHLGSLDGQWPEVSAEEGWCGEHEERKL